MKSKLVRFTVFLLLLLLLLASSLGEGAELAGSVTYSKNNVVHGEQFTVFYSVTGGSGNYTGLTCTLDTYSSGIVIVSDTVALDSAEGSFPYMQPKGEFIKVKLNITDSDGTVKSVSGRNVTVGRTFFEWVGFILDNYGSLFLRGVLFTMLIAIVGTVCGFLIGLLVAVLRTIPEPAQYEKLAAVRKGLLKILSFILGVYIEVFRGTPMMVQAMVIYYGLAGLGLRVPALTAALFIVSINTGAYMAEIIRGGIISVDKGQKEAGHAIGMSHWQCMIHVVLPQAVRNIMPSIGNEFVVNIKDSSVLNVISVSELFFVSKSAAGTYLRYFEVFFITAIIYLVLTFTTTRLLRILERKMDGKANYTIYGSQSDSHAAVTLKKEEIPDD